MVLLEFMRVPVMNCFCPSLASLILFLALPWMGAGAPVLQWSELPPLPDQNGVAGPFVGVHRDALIVAGGANFPNQPVWETDKVWHDDIYVMTDRGDGPAWRTAGKLPWARAYGAAVSTERGVLCIGGDDAETVHGDVLLLVWDAALEALTWNVYPALPEPVAYGAATLIGDVVYLAGGQRGKALDSATSQVWVYDLARGAEGDWERLSGVPWSSRAFLQAATQHNGYADCLYVFGGRRQTGGSGEVRFLDDVWEFNPREGVWRERGRMPKPMMAGTAIGYGQSHVMLLGGADGTMWEEAEVLRDEHPGFPRQTFLYHTITDTWSPAGESPRNHVTTIPVLWGESIIIASGEVRPRVRSPSVWNVTPLPKSVEFGAANYVVLIAYLLAMVGVGVYWARRNKGTDDYFRGGQRMAWWAAGCSIFATMLSSLTFTGLPSKAFAQDWVYLVGNMMIPVVAVVAVFVALPFYRCIDATSAYEYLELRFSRAVRLLGSGFFTVFHVFRMAVVMSLTGLALSVATPLSSAQSVVLMGVLSILYCAMGGVEAVIWTDTVQTIVLLGGAVLAFVLLVVGVEGGWAGFIDLAARADKFRMANFNWDITSAQVAIWVIVLGAVGQNLSSYTADQAVVQRYMTTPTEKLAARSIWTNAILSLFASVLFFALGSALFAFYATHPDKLDPTITTDQVFPLFIAREMPVGLAGLIVAGIFAAAQSTVSTSMNSTATTMVTDFLRPMNACRDDRGYLRAARILTVLMGVLGTSFGLGFIDPDIKSLFDEFIKLIGLVLGVLGGLFLLGVLTRTANATGALAGCAGGTALMIWLWKDSGVSAYFYPFAGVTGCFLIGFAASLVLKGPKRTEGLTVYSRKLR